MRAHTARPFTGRNAIHRLGEVITKVASYEPRDAVIDGVDYVEQLQAVDVDGGVAPNVVPDRATCMLNHRVAPDRSGRGGRVRRWLSLSDVIEEGDRIEVDGLGTFGAADDSTNEHLLALVGSRRASRPRARSAGPTSRLFAN